MKKLIRFMAALAAVAVLVIIVYYLYDALRPRTTIDKLAQIIHLEDQRLLTRTLRGFLDDPDPEVRARAALAVGRVGGPGSGQALLGMLSDSSLDVAAMAAFGIGISRETAYATRVLEAAFELPSSVCASAVAAAGRLADSSMTGVADALVGFLSHPSPDVREEVCLALFRAGARSKESDILAMTANEPDDLVRQSALFALARLESQIADQYYIEFLADPDPFVRSLAVLGLGHIESKEAAHYLAIALNDADQGVESQAITALADRNSPEARTLLAKKLESAQNARLVIVLLDALRKQQNEGGLATARLMLTSEPPSPVVAALLKYITAIQKGRAVGLIDSLARFNDPLIKAACAEAFGIVGGQQVIPRLSVLFSHEDPMVRRQAFSELVRIDTANTDFYIGEALNDQDFTVVVTAIEQIKQHLLWDYLSPLADLVATPEYADVDIRRSVVDAMSAFLERAPDDSTVHSVLQSALLDPEYVVRRDAAAVLRNVLGRAEPVVHQPAATRYSRRRIAGALKRYRQNPGATIVTGRGEIDLELYFDIAPLTVMNFIDLATDGFYDGLTFHRVVPNFVVQGGDPRGDGWGGPDYFVRCEYSPEPYRRGSIGMATSGRDTGGSQFFITLSPQPHLEGRYTVFGQVQAGMEVVDRLLVGDVIETILIHEETK